MIARRRLAAILAADVVGYGRLMEVDEVATLAALKERRREVLDPLVAKHHGRVFKVTGDGVLVEFASAVNAVQCAVELQEKFGLANAGVADDRRIVLRIGINLGDVMAEGSDLYGDGVNIAARLEGLAEAGGICVSGDVYRQVRSKLPLDFQDLGERQLKSIASQVRVYAVRSGGKAALARPTLALPDKPSIAVLLFENLSGDPEQEYFADGIVEEIITALSRLRWLFVIARNSGDPRRCQPVDLRQICGLAGSRGSAFVARCEINGTAAVGLPWPSLLAFVRVTSNPRIHPRPLAIGEAWRQVEAWLDCPPVWIPIATERHRAVLAPLVTQAGSRSDLVPDAHLAALAVEHGLILCSTDGDFARFPGLRWENPLRPSP
jgi:toxin-antitoxin system PIN domain toxin